MSLDSVSPDPQWFYSSLAQVGSAFVGFLGGFFILRLQTYSQEWRDARLEINRLYSSWNSTQRTLEKLGSAAGERNVDAEQSLLARRDDVARQLAPLIDRRTNAAFPRELLVMAVLLVLLLGGGVVAPLLALPRPAEAEKVIYLAVVAGLFVVMGVAMLLLALGSLKNLRAPLPQQHKSWAEILEVETGGAGSTAS